MYITCTDNSNWISVLRTQLSHLLSKPRLGCSCSCHHDHHKWIFIDSSRETQHRWTTWDRGPQMLNACGLCAPAIIPPTLPALWSPCWAVRRWRPARLSCWSSGVTLSVRWSGCASSRNCCADVVPLCGSDSAANCCDRTYSSRWTTWRAENDCGKS